MKFKKGENVYVPTYEEVKKILGTRDDGRPKSKIGFTKTMIDMCPGNYIIDEPTENGYVIIKGADGKRYGFDNKIFKNKKLEKPNRKIDIKNIILKQLKHRYEFVSYDRLGTQQRKYGIIDSIYPYHKVLAEVNGMETYKLNQHCVAISERIAKDMNVPQLHISELVAMYGYTKTSIKNILMNVKKRNHKLLVIGYGGTGTNFLHWLSQMAAWTNTSEIFDDLIVSDDDYFDSVNLLRVPFILPEINNIRKKVHYFQDYARISREVYKVDKNVGKNHMYKGYIHYGAPDLETRQLLHDEEISFIAATHRDNACALMLRPDLDTELMVETYGKIALTPFFMNHIRMTISFMEFLGDDETTEKVLYGKEKSILEYDFVKDNEGFVNGGERILGRTMYPIIATHKNYQDIEIGE